MDLRAANQAAEQLFAALQTRDHAAAWRVKWNHPRFRDRPVSDVREATLELSDAQLVIAREHAFETWTDLAHFTVAVVRDNAIARFEAAADAIVSGDANALRTTLRDHRQIVCERSSRRHGATLLHYIAANGVEAERQKTSSNAIEIARILLEGGAEPDAVANMYDGKCTTMSMLVSSSPPAEAGVQGALAELLLDSGASLDIPDNRGHAPLLTALIFGYLGTARILAARGARVGTLPEAAGLGLVDETTRLLPIAGSRSRHEALALASQLGHVEIVRMLLDAGEDADRLNPDGYHAHATPLHQAVVSNQLAMVELFVERGARLDIVDTIYSSTPLGWAIYTNKPAIAEYLRAHGAQDS